MADTFGFGTDTTGFSSTVHDHILKEVVATLRAGLISLPKGAVVPASIISQRGENFTLRSTAYPDLLDSSTAESLTEGVAPAALKLGIDTMDWTVVQSGARTVITDIGEMQSPHPLSNIAMDKIKRLANDNIDKIGRTALLALSSTEDFGSPLTTPILLDMKAAAQAADFEPIPNVGYYVILHPNALRGLEGEEGLNGYTDVSAHVDGSSLTKGAVGQYRGMTFLTSSKFTATDGVYPVFVVPANSIACGDVSTLRFIPWSAAGVGNELQQLKGVGYKAILGAKVLDFSEVADGAGSNSASVPRVLRYGVSTGVGSF